VTQQGQQHLGQQHLTVCLMHSSTQGGGCLQQRHVEPPHLQSQQQTLSIREPGGAGVRGKGALSGGSTRGARGAGAEGGSNPSGELPNFWFFMFLMLIAANKESVKQIDVAYKVGTTAIEGAAPLRIAPLLRAQGHVEARRQKVGPIRGHAAKDRLAVLRDAVAPRQWLAAGGAGAAKVLDLLWRRAATSPVPETDPEHSMSTASRVEQAWGARGALSGGCTRGARGAGAELSGRRGSRFESLW
jgi:hypothetical protein